MDAARAMLEAVILSDDEIKAMVKKASSIVSEVVYGVVSEVSQSQMTAAVYGTLYARKIAERQLEILDNDEML